ncbi:hypothetical protein EDC04DRAFT_1247187 [Pisolithus marmoratus]|nr:hypothetical protein EDC04DRAFT_1247187 [Pisolithus marmoratus]
MDSHACSFVLHTGTKDCLWNSALCLLPELTTLFSGLEEPAIMDTITDVHEQRLELYHCPPGHDRRVDALFRLACALHERFDESGDIHDLREAITLHCAALELRPTENDAFERSLSLHNLALCLSTRYDNQGLVDDLERAITLGRAALELRPPGHPYRDASLHNLACDLRTMARKHTMSRDLEEVIQLHRAALELRLPGHHKRSSSLHQLALCLSDRYDDWGAVSDLEEVVMLRRAELELCPRGHPDRGESLDNLACSLSKRFAAKAVIRDLEEAIELYHAALELRPTGHPDRFLSLHQLALCLSNRHNKLGVIDDLEEAIRLGRVAVELCPPEHPYHAASIHNLACDLRTRFTKYTTLRDLQESIELLYQTLELRPTGHPDRSSSLHQLALCLSNRHDKVGEFGDLEEAIRVGRAALELRPLGCPNRDVSLHNLACDLRTKFIQYGAFIKYAALCDLEESIELFNLALELRPTGHPDRSSSLHGLSLCLSSRHDKRRLRDDLEEAIRVGRAALELCPPGHSDRSVVLYSLACDLRKKFQKQDWLHMVLHQAMTEVRPPSRTDVAFSLFELSQGLWDQFQRQAIMTDLDNAICLATHALELQVPREDVSVEKMVERLAQGASSDESVMLDRVENNLCALANYHRTRFQTQHTIVDLNAAITSYHNVLQLRPTEHPGRVSSLRDLAHCLADRSRQRDAATDLDRAIVLEQEALQLLMDRDPDYDVSRCCLPTYVQMKVRAQVTMTTSDASSVTHFNVKQVIHDVVLETIKTMPARLLHTPTGILCNRDGLVSHFMSSQQYKRLVSLLETCDRDQHTKHIRTAISKYFQYVTLSHRWGKGEPSLRDIEGKNILILQAIDGFGKLQAFCAVACGRGYLWAWSDTCCIDKHSSAELQEAIGSMFACEWFRRGWTLQELLAPQNILFYTQSWSLYKNITSPNHKTDLAVLEELERATGIESRFLTDFSPCMDDARSRLQWASLRRTTRPEDIAYSLFGIFNSGDISVLDWIGEPSPFHSCFPAHIISFQRLPTPPPHPTAGERSPAISKGLSSFEVRRNFCGLRATSLPPQLPSRSLAASSVTRHVPAVHLRTLDSYASNDVYDFHSLTRVPLPQFFNRLLILPCIAYLVTTVQLKWADPSTSRYTYNIEASSLRPLEITLPSKLTMSQGGLHLVRPWNSKLLGPLSNPDAVTEEQLLSMLAKPFNALLLTQLPHNEHKRIASSTLITAQPILDRSSILKEKVRMFNIV